VRRWFKADKSFLQLRRIGNRQELSKRHVGIGRQCQTVHHWHIAQQPPFFKKKRFPMIPSFEILMDVDFLHKLYKGIEMNNTYIKLEHNIE
jgi:hypothetical protein